MEDSPFRPIVLAGFAAVLVIALRHRLKSWASREKLDRRQEGPVMMVMLRLAGLATWAGVIAYIINPRSMAWSAMPLPLWLRWTGVALCAMVPWLLWWTLASLGPNLTDTVVTRERHTLVTRGPYRWVRHPFYDCAALLILGISLTAANWFMLFCGTLTLALLVIRTRTEEANLVARFGDGYRDYMERTGRFFPSRRKA
jgi:protein-S-isoprenylcysteine O-methyltransferase Ste14